MSIASFKITVNVVVGDELLFEFFGQSIKKRRMAEDRVDSCLILRQGNLP